MKNKKREDGFYWVKLGNNRWVVCEYAGICWFFQGASFKDENFKEIDEIEIKSPNNN